MDRSKEAHDDQLNSEEAASLLSDEVVAVNNQRWLKGGTASTPSSLAYILLLTASLIANLAFAIALYSSYGSQNALPQAAVPKSCPTCQQCPPPVIQQTRSDKTQYAGLEYNVNGTWEFETPYAQEDIAAADEVWKALDVSNAFVALTKDHAKALGLPASLPFPWDRGRKELYLISSIHSMHCLTVIHRSNLEYRTNHTQTYSTEHILHCLDNIRVDIQCNADDTPRFIPPKSAESTAKTGVGQIRQCRSWDRLNEWAEEHGACFKYNQFLYQELKGEKVWPSAWQFCDRDSEYLSTVQRYFHKDADWVPPTPDWPDIDQIS